MCREPPPGHVFVESLAEIDPRKVAEVLVVRGSRHIRSLQYSIGYRIADNESEDQILYRAHMLSIVIQFHLPSSLMHTFYVLLIIVAS